MNTLEGPAKDKSTQRVGDLKPSLQVGQYKAPFDPYSSYESYEEEDALTYLPHITRALASEFHPPMSRFTYRKQSIPSNIPKPSPDYASQYTARQYRSPSQQNVYSGRGSGLQYYVNPKAAWYTPSNTGSSVQSTPKESPFMTPLGSPKRVLYRYNGNTYASPIGARKRNTLVSTGNSSRSSGKSVQFVERVYYI